MKLYFTNQTIDRVNAREKELRIEQETGIDLDNPFYDGDAKEVKQLDATGTSDLTPDEIVGRDLKRIKEADGLLAYISNDKNIGSCMEIAIASFSWGKPVYVVTSCDHIYNHPWIVYFANRVFKTDYEFIKYAWENFPECKQFHLEKDANK